MLKDYNIIEFLIHHILITTGFFDPNEQIRNVLPDPVHQGVIFVNIIVDLAGSEAIQSAHLAEALHYPPRMLGL